MKRMAWGASFRGERLEGRRLGRGWAASTSLALAICFALGCGKPGRTAGGAETGGMGADGVANGWGPAGGAAGAAGGGATGTSSHGGNVVANLCTEWLVRTPGNFGAPVPAGEPGVSAAMGRIGTFLARGGADFCGEGSVDEQVRAAAAALSGGFDATTEVILSIDPDLREALARVHRRLPVEASPGAAMRNGVLLSLGTSLRGAVCGEEGTKPAAALGFAATVHSLESVYRLWWTALTSELNLSRGAWTGRAGFWKAQRSMNARLTRAVSQAGRADGSPLRAREPGAATLVAGDIPLACEPTLKVVSDRGVIGAENGMLDADESVVLSVVCRNTGTRRLRSESLTPVLTETSCAVAPDAEVVLPELEPGAEATIDLGPIVVPSRCGGSTNLTYRLTSSTHPGGGELRLALLPRVIDFSMTLGVEVDDPGSSRHAQVLQTGGHAELNLTGRVSPGFTGTTFRLVPATQAMAGLYASFEVERSTPLLVARDGSFRLSDDVDVVALRDDEALERSLALCGPQSPPVWRGIDLRQNDAWVAVGIALEATDDATMLAATLRAAPELGSAIAAMRARKPSLSVRAILRAIAGARRAMSCDKRRLLAALMATEVTEPEAAEPAAAPSEPTACARPIPGLDPTVAALRAALPDLSVQDSLVISSNLLRLRGVGLLAMVELIQPVLPPCPDPDATPAAAADSGEEAPPTLEELKAELEAAIVFLIDGLGLDDGPEGETLRATLLDDDAIAAAVLAPCDGLEWLEDSGRPPYVLWRFVRHEMQR